MVKEKTNKKFMLLSFFGILFVVAGHFGSVGLSRDIFPYYSFHIPLFFFISGYFYNVKSEENVKKFFFKKLKRLIIPFTIWNLFYGILVTILRNKGIVAAGQNITMKNFFIDSFISNNRYWLNTASWFLVTLFFTSVIYLLIRKTVKKVIKNENVKEILMLILFVILGFIAVYISRNIKYNQYFMQLFRVMFSLEFIHLGYLYKIKLEAKDKVSNYILLPMLIGVNLVLIKVFGNLNFGVQRLTFYNPCSYIITSITGIWFWLRICAILEKSLGESKIINYISNNTLDIMMHHAFFAFIINYCLYKLNVDGFNINSFKHSVFYCYVPRDYKQFIYLYYIAGIFGPILVRYIYEKLKTKLVKNKAI